MPTKIQSNSPSYIPAAVLIPAPVNATQCLALRIISATLLPSWIIESRESWYSHVFMASLTIWRSLDVRTNPLSAPIMESRTSIRPNERNTPFQSSADECFYRVGPSKLNCILFEQLHSMKTFYRTFFTTYLVLMEQHRNERDLYKKTVMISHCLVCILADSSQLGQARDLQSE